MATWWWHVNIIESSEVASVVVVISLAKLGLVTLTLDLREELLRKLVLFLVEAAECEDS